MLAYSDVRIRRKKKVTKVETKIVISNYGKLNKCKGYSFKGWA